MVTVDKCCDHHYQVLLHKMMYGCVWKMLNEGLWVVTPPHLDVKDVWLCVPYMAQGPAAPYCTTHVGVEKP